MQDEMREFCQELKASVLLNKRGIRRFPDMRRVQESWVAEYEKRTLLWLAARTPQWIGPDHLTVLGFTAQIGAGVFYAFGRWNKYSLLGVIVFLAPNGVGGSLDGPVGRVRKQLRPRYRA